MNVSYENQERRLALSAATFRLATTTLATTAAALAAFATRPEVIIMSTDRKIPLCQGRMATLRRSVQTLLFGSSVQYRRRYLELQICLQL